MDRLSSFFSAKGARAAYHILTNSAYTDVKALLPFHIINVSPMYIRISGLRGYFCWFDQEFVRSSWIITDQMLGHNNMSPNRLEVVLMLLMLMVYNASGAFVGINIGTNVSDLPSASDIVSILKAKKIQHVRLVDSNHEMLVALANTGIEVMVGVPNNELLRVGQSRPTAADWINKNVAAYIPATNITYIAVGDEILTTVPNAALVLVPALQFLQSALLAANLNTQVKLSSPHSMDMISKAFPPSAATFNSTWSSIMLQYLGFLKRTGSSFMLNAQPYYGYVKGQGVFPLEYALFRSLNPNSQIADPNTNLFYTNMFDAMVDATYNSMKAMNFTDIPVMVTASGWPWHSARKEPAADVDNALAYNTNLIRHVLNNSGTPSQPNNQVSTYLFELFSEDLRSGSVSGESWGIMFTNASAVYSLTFEDVATASTDSPALHGMFCVANSSAPHSALKQSLDWACGPGSANCSAIQPGQPCYKPDDIVAVASYAFNDYYHRTQASGGTCNFNSTATISSTDPRSTGVNGSGMASGPISIALTEVKKVMMAAIEGLQWCRGALVPMKNDGTGSSCASGVDELLQRSWQEGAAAQRLGVIVNINIFPLSKIARDKEDGQFGDLVLRLVEGGISIL
ncbi:Glucan endo-1,3-beta-glucosidase 4 [Triticum urartu]|uniref:glucan endo-1,3-beta-D-glucosidase n=1 Tax=Triticum urartu TaxID=4572 RepID=M7ZJM8_TRIUA|nr:Glucan endo-1,3-beta-glucosidase 4 [Triticum urartu]